MTVETYMTLQQAAAANPHVSYYTLRDAVTEHRLAHIRLGRTGRRGVRLTQAAIDEFLRGKTCPAIVPARGKAAAQPADGTAIDTRPSPSPRIPARFRHLHATAAPQQERAR